MKGKYFGYKCEFFSGQWELCDVQADTENTRFYEEYEPVLVYCRHPDNKEKEYEGNCCDK